MDKMTEQGYCKICSGNPVFVCKQRCKNYIDNITVTVHQSPQIRMLYTLLKDTK